MRQPHVRDFEVLHGDYELAVLLSADLDSQGLHTIGAAVKDAIPAATAHVVILSRDMAADETAFRLGGLHALRLLLEDHHR